MPVKAIRKTAYDFSEPLPGGNSFQIFDILLITVLLVIFGFTFSGVYKQTTS